jgi:hypothetical protein
VCTRKSRTLQDLRKEIEITAVAIPSATLQEVCQSVARYHQQCIGDGGRYFKDL